MFKLDPINDIASLLSGLTATLKTAREVRKTYDRELAIEFNPLLHFFPIGENKLSSILAFFLDPLERHGQGEVFLKSFLQEFLPPGRQFTFSKVSIRCEQPTDENRRIDIYLNFDNGRFAVGIETKIWARDQNNQLKDYSRFLHQHHGDSYCLIYLPPYDRTPGEHSISAEELKRLVTTGMYICRNHSSDLSNLLRKWIADCRAEKVRLFLKDLYQHIQFKLNGEKFMGENELIADYILQSDERLKATMTLLRAGESVKQGIFTKFNDQLKAVSVEAGVEIVEYTLEGSGLQWKWFTFRIEEGDRELWLRYQFENSGHRGFYWGVLTNGAEQPVLSERIKKYLGNNSHQLSKYWLWWNWHEKKDWDEQTYVEVANGTFANKILNELKMIVPKVRDFIHDNAALIWETKKQTPVSDFSDPSTL